MTTSHKLLFIFLSIITFGIFPLVIYLLAKNQKTNQQLSTSDKVNVNLDKLKKNLGGLENIIGVEFTYTKVKILIKKRPLIKIQELKKLKGISGVFVNSGSVTLIVGNSAKKIADSLS